MKIKKHAFIECELKIDGITLLSKKHAFIEYELKIDGITLLSIEEYEACREYIPPLNDLWWLRSPGRKMVHDAVNVAYGLVDGYGLNVESDLAVRPALKITDLKSANLQLGEKFDLFDYTWTVISNSLALCDGSIGTSPFRKDSEAGDANDYEASDVKVYVENWLTEQMAKEEYVPNYKKVVEGFDKLCDSDEGMNALEDVLCDMAMNEFEPYEAAKAIRNDITDIELEETYDLLNKFFIGIFGWSLETLLERTKEALANQDEDEDEENDAD